MPRPLSVPLRRRSSTSSAGPPFGPDRGRAGHPLWHGPEHLAVVSPTADQGLAPNYSSCGRPVPPQIQQLLHIACDLKRDHPAWAPGDPTPTARARADGRLPSIRSLQLAFVRAGVHRPRRLRAAVVVVSQAVEPHEIWQVDAVENVPLATGQRICWPTVTDEVSGAILATEVSPPPPVGTRPRAGDPDDVPPRLRGLGPARPRARRQRLSLGHPPRPALGAGVVVDRAGRRTDLESAGPAHAQSQGGAVQRRDPAVGRAAHLRRLPTRRRGCWPGSAESNANSTRRSEVGPASRCFRNSARRGVCTGEPTRRPCGISPGWTPS